MLLDVRPLDVRPLSQLDQADETGAQTTARLPARIAGGEKVRKMALIV